MKLIDIQPLTIPDKKSETFRKIDLTALYTFDFKEHKEFQPNHGVDLTKIDETHSYQSGLFEIAKELETQQYHLNITQSTDEPIILTYDLEQETTLYSHSLKITVQKNVKASIIEVFKGKCSNSAAIINRYFDLQEQSELIYAKIEEIPNSNFLIYNAHVNQHHNSMCEFSAFEFGKGFVVNTYENSLNDKNTHYILNALVKLENEAYVSNIINTIHTNESSLSDINVKHALKGKSTAVFKAKSIVEEKALFTKAFQNSDTILLSNDATIFAQPHLEISIDELEASHGATTGTLDKTQLLYLQSRGIPEALAHKMLLDAFEAEIYHNISDEQVKAYILAYVGGNDV